MYRTCPDCGAALDPDERCDCRAEAEKEQAACQIQIRKRPYLKSHNVFPPELKRLVKAERGLRNA